MDYSVLSTRPCAHHDAVELRIQAQREAVQALTELQRTNEVIFQELRKDNASIRAELGALASKLTLIVILATPMWTGLVALIYKWVSGQID